MLKKSEIKSHRKSMVVLLIVLAFFIVLVKLIYVQLVMYSKINHKVEQMVRREIITQAKRGDILDTNGKIIATSILKYSPYLDPKVIKNFEEVKRKLNFYGISIPQKSIVEFKNTSYVPLKVEVDYITMQKIKNEKLHGVGFVGKYKRQYPEGRLLSNIMGVVDNEGHGREGIEKKCDEYLLGENVKYKHIRDAKGHLISDKLIDKSKLKGFNVELTIDKNIQFIAEQELRKAFEKYKPLKAICIVQNPKNGDILAMVSLPDFDFKNQNKEFNALRNTSVCDAFEPGSIFKPIILAAALEENKITLSDVFYLENGKYKIANHVIKDDHLIKGSADVRKIIEMSSNIGIIKIAQKLTDKNVYEYIRKFGFASLTGIDFPGEVKGSLKDYKDWNKLSLPTIAFGQGISVNAVQMINAYSAIANGGILMRPRLIQNIQDYDREIPFTNDVVRTVISSQTAKIVRNVLKGVVKKGTGISAGVFGYSVAGKTGTAQKIDRRTGLYSKKDYVASFCGMLPVDNPEFVVLVVIDSPKGNDYYAASVASPVFSRISQKVAQYLGITPDDLEEE